MLRTRRGRQNTPLGAVGCGRVAPRAAPCTITTTPATATSDGPTNATAIIATVASRPTSAALIVPIVPTIPAAATPQLRLALTAISATNPIPMPISIATVAPSLPAMDVSPHPPAPLRTLGALSIARRPSALRRTSLLPRGRVRMVAVVTVVTTLVTLVRRR